MSDDEFVTHAIASGLFDVSTADDDADDWRGPKPWPKVRVEAVARRAGPQFHRCPRHEYPLRIIDLNRPPRIPSPVTMTWRMWTDGLIDRDIWIGQCPDCGTIYYAIRESAVADAAGW